MRFPPGESTRNAECPSQVSSVATTRILRSGDRPGGRNHPADPHDSQRLGAFSPHMPALSQGEWSMTVTLRFPFESDVSVNFTHAVLFV